MILFMKGNQINQCQLPPSTLPTDTSSFTCPLLPGLPQDQGLPPSTLPTDTSSFTCPLLPGLPQDQGPLRGEFHLLQQQQQEVNDLLLIGRLDNYPVLDQKQQQQQPNNLSSIGGSSNYTLLDQTNNGRGSVKWMSSKMRLMKKMMGADKHQIIVTKQRRPPSLEDQTQLRVCSDCNTTKTPLWRSGPQGPKSLCNACGIRRMKARRAMRSEVDRTVPFKKRFKMISSSSGTCAEKKLLWFDDVTINKLGFSQAFPQEERDAAILLMALSCGLIHR